MPSIRLSAADREALGCPEFLPNPLANTTVRESIELQKLGYPTPRLLAKALQGSDETTDYEAWIAFVWLALRRAGVEVDAKTLDFDVVKLELISDDEPVEPKDPGGKAPEPEGSTNSTSSNSTSTATSRAKSTPTALAS